MAYTKARADWQDGSAGATPILGANLDTIETGIADAHTTADAAVAKSIVTTAGDLIYGTASATVARLGIGTARQALLTNSGATAPEWAASMQSLLTAQADTVYASAANTPARLAKGTGLQYYRMNSGATAPEWATLATSEYDVLTKVTTAVTVVSTTTLTDLLNYTIAAGAIGTDKTIFARLHGHGLSNAGANRAFQLKIILGGTTLFDTGAAVYATPKGIAVTTSATRFTWTIDLFVSACGAANSQFLSGTIAAVRGGIPATGYGFDHMYVTSTELDGAFPFTSAGRTAVDMASAQALQVQIAPEASHASLEWKMESAFVAVIG